MHNDDDWRNWRENADDISDEDRFILERMEACHDQWESMSASARKAHDILEQHSEETKQSGQDGLYSFQEHVTVPADMDQKDAEEALKFMKLCADPSTKFIVDWEKDNKNTQPKPPKNNNKGAFKP